MYMTISSLKTMRPRLCVLREAAGAVFFGRPTTPSPSSSAWGQQKRRAPISAFHKAPLHSSLCISRPYPRDLGPLHCTHIIPTSPSSSLHGPLPLFGRSSYSTSSTKLAHKASTKSRASSNRKRVGPGKPRTGSGVRRSVVTRASSRQKSASFLEERNSQRPAAALQKAGVSKSSAKKAFNSREKSEVRSDSRDDKQFGNAQKQSQNRTSISKPTAATFSRQGSLAVKRGMRSQEGRGVGADKAGVRKMGSQKRGKRVMRLDPRDQTSKRLFEGYPLPGEEIQQEAPVAATTGRVQFRQIVPAPKLLQHIEKHMLGRRRPSELQRAGYDMKIIPAPLDNIPYSKKGERQPIQEEAFRHKLRFAAAAKSESSFPPLDIPEVAFAGRSNVGKSSLINALTRQWGVARVSEKPGFTQSINFFRLGGRLCLVDLPGYGFAYAAEEKKEAWEELVKEFVTTRVGLKRVYVLVDAKWGLKLKDEEIIELMEKAGTKYQIVLTKSDTVTPMDLARRVTQIQEVFKANKSLMLPMIMVSSKTGEGLEFFRANVARLAKASLI
eukprot:c22655_g1_i1 orf=649-2310(-)